MRAGVLEEDEPLFVIVHIATHKEMYPLRSPPSVEHHSDLYGSHTSSAIRRFCN